MPTLLHASDLHFGRPHFPDAARALEREIERLDPDVIVLAGDFTQRAKVAEFQAARAFLKSLPDIPTVVVPGNHDVPLYRVLERLTAPLRNYQKFVSSKLDSITRVPGATIVALDSTAPHRAIVNGRIGRDQLEFAARIFRDAPPQDIKILVAHHHLASAPDDESDSPLPGACGILEACRRMGVELILGGHLHRGFAITSGEVCPGEGDGEEVLMVHSGTVSSTRGRVGERGRNSLNVISIDPDRIVVSYRLLDAASTCFEPRTELVWSRSEGSMENPPGQLLLAEEDGA